MILSDLEVAGLLVGVSVFVSIVCQVSFRIGFQRGKEHIVDTRFRNWLKPTAKAPQRGRRRE